MELSVVNDIIVKGNRMFVSNGLGKNIIKRIHTGQMGVTKCTKRARDIQVWPKMSSDIEEMSLMFNTFLEKRKANPKVHLMPH